MDRDLSTKFLDPNVTAKGEARAHVALQGLRTLWINTGTLCNIACANCYIESSPSNDRLAYVSVADITPFLDELQARSEGACEIGFTGGEPFLNPDACALVEAALARGHRALVLTNAMRPMLRPKVMAALEDLIARYGDQLTLRVSLDHPEPGPHDTERGAGSYVETLAGIDWLMSHGARVAVAGRLWGEDDHALRERFAALFAARGWSIDATDPTALVLFPEMTAHSDPPEISTACWGILGKSPTDVMCASSRMLVKRQGQEGLRVVACTLLPYDPGFDLGASLTEASRPVSLNHRHCATFCVLGGGKCSA